MPRALASWKKRGAQICGPIDSSGVEKNLGNSAACRDLEEPQGVARAERDRIFVRAPSAPAERPVRQFAESHRSPAADRDLPYVRLGSKTDELTVRGPEGASGLCSASQFASLRLVQLANPQLRLSRARDIDDPLAIGRDRHVCPRQIALSR